MIESHRLASAGKDKRDFVLAFARHLDDCHELFMRESSGKYWGDPFRIWPEGNPWIKQRDELFKMVEVLESELELQDNFTKQIRLWNLQKTERALTIINEGETEIKKSPELSKTIASNIVLRLTAAASIR